MTGVQTCALPIWLYKDENQEAKDLAFESLEKLRKKFSDLDYDKELAEYREGKYENLS